MSSTHSTTSAPQRSRTHKILDAFPKRPMSILHSRLTATWLNFSFFIVSTIFMIFLPVFQAPDLIDDYRISKNPVKDTQAQIQGHCRVMRHILINCKANISYHIDPALPQQSHVEREFSYLGFKAADSISAVRSEKNPALITTDLEIKHLKNRITFLVVWFLGFFTLCLYSGSSLINDLQFRKMLRSKVILKPVIAEISEISENNGIPFSTSIKGKKRVWNTPFREHETPLFISPGTNLALAVTILNTSFILLLDEDFSCLDFTEEEEQSLRIAIEA